MLVTTIRDGIPHFNRTRVFSVICSIVTRGLDMNHRFVTFPSVCVILSGVAALVFAQQPSPTVSSSGLRMAATYLDKRLDWWAHWPNAGRDHDTFCVSCHTALPYALARPVLHRALNEPEAVAPERILFENVTKRVRLWNEVEPFYPDQRLGLPKT